MKNKIMLLALASFFLIAFMQTASAEVWVYTNTIFPDENTVRYHAYYQVEDTSFVNILIQKPVRVELLSSVQSLPYNISATYPQYSNAYVDYCNYTITWQKNEYDSSLGLTQWRIVNTTLITSNTMFNNTPANFTLSVYDLRARDGLVADMDCHYTNKSTLFIDNTYFGFVQANVPAFECAGCGEHSYEELVKLNQQIEDNNFKEVGLADNIQQIVEKNFKIWTYLYWLIKIGLILIGVGLAFIPIYYIYLLVKKIEESFR